MADPVRGLASRLSRFAVLLAGAPLFGAMDPAAPPPSPVPAICHAPEPSEESPPAPAASILAGYGTQGFLIRTRSPQAQAFFDNGLELAHAFAHRPAVAAFRRAEALDPDCALCVWGEAWSRGPTINFTISAKEADALRVLADKAAVLAAHGPERERELTQALTLRYRRGGGRGEGDLAFARAMDAIARERPDDQELAVLAADAWMIPASLAGARSNLGRARELLKAVLDRNPDNPGAIHFYIHATENDGVGVLALPYAERLQALAPAASHLVHMPSHTFLWAGRYRLAEASNLDAVAIDRREALRLKPPGGAAKLPYHLHNLQYGLGAALLDGDARGALALAAEETEHGDGAEPDDLYAQDVLGSAYFAFGRFADQAALSALRDPKDRLPYASRLLRYAEGEAAARRGDAASVKAAAAAIDLSPGPLKGFAGRDADTAGAMLMVARSVLLGRAAMLEARYADAAAAYRRAAQIQEARLGRFRDPPLFWYPVRRSLAAALLAQGDRRAAAEEAQTVLLRWPYDPLSLRILAESSGPTDPQGRDRLKDAQANWIGDVRALPLALL